MSKLSFVSILLALLLPLITVHAEPTVSSVTFKRVDSLFAHDSGLTDLQKEEEWKNIAACAWNGQGN